MMIWVRKDRLYLSMIFNLVFLIGSIVHFRIHPYRSDMLPVIQIALDRWKALEDPYHSFMILGSSPDTMAYLPGTLFMHLPAWSLGLDLRWNTVFYRAIWMFLLWRVEQKNPQTSRLTVLHYFALSPYLNFRHDLYFEGFLLMIVAYFLYPKLRAWTLTLAICTRQWAWILAPFLVYRELVRKKDHRFQIIAEHTFALIFWAGVFFLLLHPQTDGQTFLRSVFWFQHEKAQAWDYGIGFARAASLLGIDGILQKLQALWCMIAFCTMLIRKPNFDKIWTWAWLTWFGFFLLNMHFWLYFWISFVLFAAVAPYDENGSANAERKAI